MAGKSEVNGGAVVSAKIPAVANPLAEKPEEIASDINYHAQYSTHFSPFKFELEQAYFATAESVRDRLIRVCYYSLIIYICPLFVFNSHITCCIHHVVNIMTVLLFRYNLD